MKIPDSKEEFLGLARGMMEEKCMSLVAAVYALADSLTKQELDRGEIRLACRRGCPLCCYQMVTCTEMEWREIAAFLNKKRKLIRKLLEKVRKGWLPYFIHMGNRPASTENTLQVYRDWNGKPCIFLDVMGICTIYSVRPIDCRTLTSTKKCTTTDTSEAKRFRFPWDEWANNIIMEESRIRGTTPLPHWVLTMR